jgi:acyl-CoA synthetase (NDP forming)
LPRGSLDPLLNPRSIALIGASADVRRISGKPLRFLRELGYRGQVYPVNPKYQELHGWRCYPSVEALPQAPDLAIVALPAEAVPGSLEQCVRVGAKAALIFSAGFAETGPAGVEHQARIAELTRAGGIRVCGPNCSGLLILHRGVAATFSSALEDRPIKPGAIAFVTQSGAFGSFFFAAAQEAGLGFSAWINTGNEADVGLAECIEHFANDPDTRVITVLAEGFRDVARLRSAAAAAGRAGKPLLLLKVARSSGGRRAAASHTASLATDDRVVDGLCRQHGIVRVNDVEGLQDGALACLSDRLPTGRGVGIIGISGGAGVMMADECARRGLAVPELMPERVERLRAMLPWYASAQNPVDATAQLMNDPRQFKACLEILADDPAIHSLVIFMGLQANIAERVATDTVEIGRSTSKPIFVTWMLTPWPARRILEAAGVPLYQDPIRCIAGLAALVQHAEASRRRPRPASGRPDRLAPGELEALRAEVRLADGEVRWSEPRTKRLLRAYGLATTAEWLVDSAEAAVERASELGFPVVLKLATAGLIHKATSRCVRLGLRSPDEVRAAAAELLALGRAHPELGPEGVLVQEQVPEGLEMLLGISTDLTFGPVVSLGIGGPQAEMLDDVAVRLPPLLPDDVAEMLEELCCRRFFEPGRRHELHERAALIDSVLTLGRLAEDLAGLDVELDVNPLFVRRAGQGVVAADAALVARRTP